MIYTVMTWMILNENYMVYDIKKKWFASDGLYPEQTKKFLNELNENGIPPEHIKISRSSMNGISIYYFNEKEIKPCTFLR